MAGFSTSLHPRAQGGKFTQTVGGVQLPAGLARLYQKFGGSTNLGFNGKTGTGYGLASGDARVSYVQQLLNKLGFHDKSGKPLAVDGKLGPLTTQAVQAAQKKIGAKPDGQVTPALVAALLKLPTTPKSGPAKTPTRARHLMSRKHH